ncbi:HAD family hydrolase [Streptomyces californicus]|uniref:HAD family hydrolase n=1 Tax=Streptomyces TaxID=1883 RepID=UPI000BF0843B|nr:HAD family hydrolase [Streptomyces sp. sk226]
MYAPPSHTPPFVLFDLDGTLVRPGSGLQRAHMDAMQAAVSELCDGVADFRYADGGLWYGEINLSGFTDAGTIAAMLRTHGVTDSNTAVAEVIGRMVLRVVRYRNQVAPEAFAYEGLPGAVELVGNLREAGIAVGLSTGNAREVAFWKVDRLGLGAELRAGGFGDSARERHLVVAQGAAAFGAPGANGLIVGDTIEDVTAAHANGLPCLGVATGAYAAEELRLAGADLVVSDLADGNAALMIMDLIRLGSMRH